MVEQICEAGTNRPFKHAAAKCGFEPTPDLLILCCACSQRGSCCNSVNFYAAARQKNRSFMRTAADVKPKSAGKGGFGISIFAYAVFIIGPVNENGFQYGPVTRPPDGPLFFRKVCLQLSAAGSSEPRARSGPQTSGRFWRVHLPKASDILSPLRPQPIRR